MNSNLRNKFSTADSNVNWFANEKSEKIILKCEECGNVIATFYSTGAIIRPATCELCRDLEKLKE